jgi:hypothetical protein
VHAARKADARAFERVLLMLNDDLGSDLFDPQARAELAEGMT